MLLDGAERIGKFFKLSPFIIGALIIGMGTSLPELASSLFAVLEGSTEIVSANVIGSNIANILLVAGLSSIMGGVIYTSRNLLNLEIPMLIISTLLFILVAHDGIINILESIIILASFVVYLAYLLKPKKFLIEGDEVEEIKIEAINKKEKEEVIKSIGWKECSLLIFGMAFLTLGAKFLVDSVVIFSEKNNIAISVISVLAIAIGTSLPEVVVSIKAVLKGKVDLAFGNIFGSNVFNLLMLVGILGLIDNLKVSKEMVMVGLPFLLVSTFIFYVSAASKKIYLWEGLMFIVVYALFVIKVIGL